LVDAIISVSLARWFELKGDIKARSVSNVNEVEPGSSPVEPSPASVHLPGYVITLRVAISVAKDKDELVVVNLKVCDPLRSKLFAEQRLLSRRG
jgi:hypothetical protein